MDKDKKDRLIQELLFEQKEKEAKTEERFYEYLEEYFTLAESYENRFIEPSTLLKIEAQIEDRKKFRRTYTYALYTLVILFLICIAGFSIGHWGLFFNLFSFKFLFALPILVIIIAGTYVDRSLFSRNG